MTCMLFVGGIYQSHHAPGRIRRRRRGAAGCLCAADERLGAALPPTGLGRLIFVRAMVSWWIVSLFLLLSMVVGGWKSAFWRGVSSMVLAIKKCCVEKPKGRVSDFGVSERDIGVTWEPKRRREYVKKCGARDSRIGVACMEVLEKVHHKCDCKNESSKKENGLSS